MNSIRVENLKYKYPNTDTFALDDISFTIKKGEFIGIVGMNAAGKTSLCYALSGLIPHFFKGAYGGNVFIGDKEVFNHEISEITAKVGLVFENPFSQMTGAKFTVYDEIAFGLENIGVSREVMHERIRESMELLDIVALKDKNPFSLSGGQMQRVAIASVIAMKPDILILDEPTSQLDPQGSEEVFRVVENLSHEGMTIIMVEQKVEKLAAYSDRILLLHNGKLIETGKPATLFSRNDLHTFGVEPPVYTKVAKALQLKHKETGLYPVTLEEIPHGKIKNNSPNDVISDQPDDTNTKSSPEIIVKDLHFSYTEGSNILNGVNLTIKGEPTAIVGQNGAGKTTFVKLLKALLKPSHGEIFINGTNTNKTTAAKLAKTIGLIFQNPNDQIFKSNVLDEVMFGPLMIGQTSDEALVNAKKMLERVGLLHSAEENPYDLSLAERKMISVASILAMNTDIVIFDEPTMGQDVEGIEKLRQIIGDLHDEGKLVLCILHDMDFVADTFSRTIVFADGKVLVDGNTRDVFAMEDFLNIAHLEQPHLTKIAHKLGFEGVVLHERELIGMMDTPNL